MLKYQYVLSKNRFHSPISNWFSLRFIFYEGKDSKHNSKITLEYFKNNEVRQMKCSSQSPDLNLNWTFLVWIENCCPWTETIKSELFRTILHSREWSKMTFERNRSLISSNRSQRKLTWLGSRIISFIIINYIMLWI